MDPLSEELREHLILAARMRDSAPGRTEDDAAFETWAKENVVSSEGQMTCSDCVVRAYLGYGIALYKVSGINKKPRKAAEMRNRWADANSAHIQMARTFFTSKTGLICYTTPNKACSCCGRTPNSFIYHKFKKIFFLRGVEVQHKHPDEETAPLHRCHATAGADLITETGHDEESESGDTDILSP